MLIFDMDGTLIDSNGIWRDVDIAFLEKRGLPYTKAYAEGVAHTIFPKAAAFTKEYGNLPESLEEIMAEWLETAGNVYAETVMVKPGVLDFLERCRAKGETMVLLTSSIPQHCHAALDHLGLRPYFERLFFANELQIEKKSPEIFLYAANAMGVAPADCTLFDDSVEACRAAKTAGMHVVGVHDPFFADTEAEMRQICDSYIMGFADLL